MQRLSSPVRPDWRCVLALLLWSQTLMAAPPTGASAVYTQLPEISPSLLRDAPVEQQESLQIDFTQGTLPVWIWGPSTDKNYRLRTTFELKGSQDSITTAVLKATCDNRMTVWLNGKQIAESNDWKSPVTANAKPLLKAGQNELVAEVANEGGIAAFILKLMTFHEDELLQTVVTNQDWQIVGTDNQPVAEKVRVMGKMGDGPWRDVLTQPEDFGRVPANTFVLLPGFQVEKLFNVPREEAGSWVAITFDPQGRLIVSDQGDKGLFRVTPAPVGSQEPTPSKN